MLKIFNPQATNFLVLIFLPSGLDLDPCVLEELGNRRKKGKKKWKKEREGRRERKSKTESKRE